MNALIHTSAIHSPATPLAAAAAPERLLSTEIFQRAKACWKKAAADKSLTSDSLAAWAIIRGADPKKGFCPITNTVKLANGAEAWGAYTQSMHSCSHLTLSALAPWASMLSEEGALAKGYRWSGSHPLLLAIGAERAS